MTGRKLRLAGFVLCAALIVGACSGGGSATTTTVAKTTVATTTVATTIDEPTTSTIEATTSTIIETTSTALETTSTALETTSTSTSTTTTTISDEGPSPITVPHGAGIQKVLADGYPVPDAVLNTANQVYVAAFTHHYGALRGLVEGDGTKRFRTGYVGGGAVDRWKREALDEGAVGREDPLVRVVALLETTPGRAEDGSIVFPYLAVKDPETWDDADAAALAPLGFSSADVAQIKVKGRYLDEKLIFSSDGVWRAFAIGG